jgi:Ribonuclease G/E
VSGQRRLYLDPAPGEARGVVTLDGKPERMLIERGDEIAVQQPGAVVAGRVRRIEKGLAGAFVDLGAGPDGLLTLAGDAVRLAEGAAVEVEITAAARGDKGPLVRLIGPAEGAPRLLRPTPGLKQRLQALAPGVAIVGGAEARAAADLAEELVLAIEHPLGVAGANLAIEPTRALVAIDVDGGGAVGGDRRRGELRINREAIDTGARLLRLKGLGGLVVFDLAGRGQDGDAVAEAAKIAFAPDMPGVAFGPVTRFGTFQLTLPWRGRPVAEVLNDPDGRPSPGTVARRLARAIEAEALRCTRVLAICAPEVAAAAETIRPALVERLGPRFDIRGDPARSREAFETRPHD